MIQHRTTLLRRRTNKQMGELKRQEGVCGGEKGEEERQKHVPHLGQVLKVLEAMGVLDLYRTKQSSRAADESKSKREETKTT
jgi:hypothetical protein